MTKISKWLPYQGTWKGIILETIIINGLKYWDEIIIETGFSPEQLNIALSELYNDGVIQKNDDNPYWIIPEIYNIHKSQHSGFQENNKLF